MTIRVLVVDDSALIRSVLSRAPALVRQSEAFSFEQSPEPLALLNTIRPVGVTANRLESKRR